jgi:hypothetical protein
MKKLIIPFLLATGTIINFTGCSTGQGTPEIHQINNTTQKQVIIKLNFPKTDPVTLKTLSINKNTLLDELKDKMYNSSYYKIYRVVSYGPINDLEGITINYNNYNYNIDYINAQDYKNNDNRNFKTEVIFKVPYDFTNESISIKYPNKYLYKPANDAVGLEIKPLDKYSALQQDVFNILNDLKNTKFYLSKKYILKGEINTKYPASSIYANFKRLLGEYNGDYEFENKVISSVEKKNYFALGIKKTIYPINIKVYPYRNGSKVVYNAYINYKVYSNGTSTLTKQDIENARKEIKNVINN